MTSVLHITNGDSAANLIRDSGVEGEVLPWRDPMHHGPCPIGLSLEELSRLRIHYLTDGKEGGAVTTEHGFTERDATLARAADYGETVLWFEHDLLDQLQILQLLDWFADTGSGIDNLSMICIDQHEGVDNFRGLGQLSSDQLAALYPKRLPVTQSQLDEAAKCWRAFRLGELTLLQEVIKKKSDDLPFMQAALIRHCQEFPWTSDGLARTERQILTLVEQGVSSPGQVFLQNMDMETSLYIGDARTFSVIEVLCNAPDPLLRCCSGKEFMHPYHSEISREEFRQQELQITEYGTRVLKTEIEQAEFLPRDEWLGGVHLHSPDYLSFWDDANQSFVKG